ncbi:MAG: DNA double-strand break repair nuclease NurA [Anaerolineae bacterium]|nr:DNA double-strand break repair nuclease NurA [Anaerolineae bacterium]
MPYPGELASKVAHSDIIRNPDVTAFLENCAYLVPPSDEECEAVAARFMPSPSPNGTLPSFVIAVDGSNYESSIDDRLPSTKIGYIKIGAILIDLQQFGALRVGKHVDPFRVAELQNNNSALTFSVPSANIRWENQPTVRESLRAWLDQQFYNPRTRFNADDPTTSLRSTLFYLASRRPGGLGTDDVHRLKIHRCPQCDYGPIEVQDIPDPQSCPACGAPVYPTDCLRLWEEVQEYQSNQIVISRLMLILEHLIPFHYIRFFFKTAPLLLSGMAFFVDGPLAIFGPAAWLHRSFMIFLAEVNRKLARRNSAPLLILGLQKTGQIVDHINLIDRFVPNNRLFAIDDEYRYKYILAGRDPANNGFGFETYYGQDFIYKTPTGRTFVFALSYPYASKDEPGVNFIVEKVQWENYPHLPTAIALIHSLESDLYQNAVVPIALAHRYTAISLQPGGKVLDLLTRKALDR